MPVRVICDECGYILTEISDFDKAIPALNWGLTLIQWVIVKVLDSRRCPSCGRKLSSDPISINVKPYKKWGIGKEKFFGWKLRRRK